MKNILSTLFSSIDYRLNRLNRMARESRITKPSDDNYVNRID